MKEKEENNKRNTNVLSSGKLKESVEVKADYSKDVRNKVDNVSKRKEFKEKTFDGKQTMKDPYTGDILHKKSGAAKAKYGNENASKHSADVDHIITIEEGYNKVKDNPFINIEDVKEILNEESNYKVINSKTNRSKGGSNNKEYVKKHAKELSDKQKKKMLEDHAKANRKVNQQIAKKTVKGAHKVGKNTAKKGMVVGAGVSTAQNLHDMIKGDTTVDEALKNISIDTVKAGAVSYVSGIGTHVIEATALTATKSASTYVATNAAKFLNAGGPAKSLTIICEVGDVVSKYAKGEVDAKECAELLGEKGTSLAMSFAAGTQGATIGGIIGGVIGSAVPGIGTIIGANIGAITGEIVGNIVGYMAGAEMSRMLKEAIHSSEVSSERLKELTIMYEQLVEELEKSRLELEKSLQYMQTMQKDVIMSILAEMKEGILLNDSKIVNESLSNICEQFGISIAFKNRDDFDLFMTDGNSKIVLGRR